MIDRDSIDKIFGALDKQIGVHGGVPISLVIIGGTALSALGLVLRTTKDVDVLGEVVKVGEKIVIKKIKKFPDFLEHAASKVQRDFNLPQDWLNLGPASQLDLGLPEGFEKRLIPKKYGKFLTIYYPDRIDLIYFKLFAALDRGGYHVEDLMLLNPTEIEIERAARWVLTQDVSPGFKQILKDFLEKHGYPNVAEKI